MQLDIFLIWRSFCLMTLNSSQPSTGRCYVNNLIQLRASWVAYLCNTFLKELAAVKPSPHGGWSLSLFILMAVDQTLRNLMLFVKISLSIIIKYFHASLILYRSWKMWGGGTAVAQWLRCCATNRKVAGSIPQVVIGILHWHNPSDRTMARASTQPLTEMSTRTTSWG